MKDCQFGRTCAVLPPALRHRTCSRSCFSFTLHMQGNFMLFQLVPYLSLKMKFAIYAVGVLEQLPRTLLFVALTAHRSMVLVRTLTTTRAPSSICRPRTDRVPSSRCLPVSDHAHIAPVRDPGKFGSGARSRMIAKFRGSR